MHQHYHHTKNKGYLWTCIVSWRTFNIHGTFSMHKCGSWKRFFRL